MSKSLMLNQIDLLNLCHTHWAWPPLDHIGSECKINHCQICLRVQRLRAYTTYCHRLLERNEDLTSKCRDGLADALLNSVNMLRGQAMVKQSDLAVASSLQHLSPPDLERLLHLTVQIMLMVRSGRQSRALVVEEHELVPPEWTPDLSLRDFIEKALPRGHWLDYKIVKTDLTARALSKHAGLHFWPTNNILDHLALDEQSGRVYIFHQMAYLKEQLHATIDLTGQDGTEQFFKRCALPRQLILEIVDSIQKLLFPLSDNASYKHLQSLTQRSSGTFDQECLKFVSLTVRRRDEIDIGYCYFASRVQALAEELKDPRPRTTFAMWLERRSGARYVMFATLIGVIFAVLLGIASLAVSSFQTYITYQQWKHPTA